MAATSFDELVIPMAEEAPHAVLLDWYRRVELAERAYMAMRGKAFTNGPAAERAVAADPALGCVVAASLANFRELRNEHAHEPRPLTSADAVAAAREALSLIGRLTLAKDVAAT